MGKPLGIIKRNIHFHPDGILRHFFKKDNQNQRAQFEVDKLQVKANRFNQQQQYDSTQLANETSEDLENTVPPTIDVPYTPNDKGVTKIPEFGSLIKVSWDFNSDGVTDKKDMHVLSQSLYLDSNQDGYSKEKDLNNDGVIDIYDLILLSKKINK